MSRTGEDLSRRPSIGTRRVYNLALAQCHEIDPPPHPKRQVPGPAYKTCEQQTQHRFLQCEDTNTLHGHAYIQVPCYPNWAHEVQVCNDADPQTKALPTDTPAVCKERATHRLHKCNTLHISNPRGCTETFMHQKLACDTPHSPEPGDEMPDYCAKQIDEARPKVKDICIPRPQNITNYAE